MQGGLSYLMAAYNHTVAQHSIAHHITSKHSTRCGTVVHFTAGSRFTPSVKEDSAAAVKLTLLLRNNV